MILAPCGHNKLHLQPKTLRQYLDWITLATCQSYSCHQPPHTMLHNADEPRQDLEFLDVQYRALIRVGLDIGATKGKDFLIYLGKFIYYGIITIYLQYGLILFAVHIFSVQIDKASAALSMFNQGSLLILKVLILIFKSDRLLKLIWDMNLLATMGKYI